MSIDASRAPVPHATIRPRSGWQAIDLRDIWKYRDLLFTLGGRDIKVRYKQTVLGALWIVLQPFLAAGILSFVFGTVANFDAPGGVPYFLFSFVGMLAWGIFSKSLSRSAASMVGNQQLVSKVYFPRLILPLSSTFSTLVDFAVTLVLMALLITVFWNQTQGAIADGTLDAATVLWHPPTLNILIMIPCLVFIMMLALGVGFCATAVAVRYRDVDYVVPVITQFLMYASPVAYDAGKVLHSDRIPQEFVWIYFLNPMASLLELFRYSVLGVGYIHTGFLVYSAVTCVTVFIAGAFVFRRMEKSFADVI